MNKYVTRTVTVYRYIFGRRNLADGKVYVTDTPTIAAPMSDSDIQERTREGEMLLRHWESKTTYAMPLEEFLAHAQPLTAAGAAGTGGAGNGN